MQAGERIDFDFRGVPTTGEITKVLSGDSFALKWEYREPNGFLSKYARVFTVDEVNSVGRLTIADISV